MSNFEFKIREMQESDILPFIELLKTCGLYYEEDDTDTKLSTKLRSDSKFMLVAESEGKLIAAIMASYDGWGAVIWHLGVLPEFRGGKIAIGLINKLESNLIEAGADRAYAFIDAKNIRMITLVEHSRMGWRKYPDLQIIPIHKKF